MEESAAASLVIEGLNMEYVETYEAAKRISERFYEEVHLVAREHSTPQNFITVRVGLKVSMRKNCFSWTADWVRLHRPQKTDENPDPEIKYQTLNNGDGFLYGSSLFDFLPKPLKRLVLRYDAELAPLRRIASENRRLKKSLTYQIARNSKAVDQALAAFNLECSE